MPSWLVLNFFALVLLIAGTGVSAQMTLTGAGKVPVAASGYVGPGDVVASATVWFGFRGYNTAFSGAVANICDAATGAICADVTWTGSTLTIPTISGLTCGVGINCVVKTMYEQVGGSNHATQATLSKMPAFTPSALNGQPCATFVSANSQVLQAGNSITAITQPWTISAVTKRTGNTGATAGILSGNTTSGLGGHNAANNYTLSAGFAPQSFSAADNTYHAVQGVFNAASSVGYTDQTATSPGNPGTNQFTGKPTIGQLSTNFWEGSICEAGVWPVGFTGSTNANSLQTGNMNTNQHNYWGVT